MGIRRVFFLHITTGPESLNNVPALAFGQLIVFLLLVGSLEYEAVFYRVRRAAAMSLIFASVTAAGVSTAVAGSAHEQFRSVRHEPPRFVAAFDNVSSAKRQPRQRLRIVVRRQVWEDEPGAIYGYPPGNYIVGSNGILYGPYPIRRSRSVVDLLRRVIRRL